VKEVNRVLKSDFEERCRKNSRYSLRAYAKFLNIDAPSLSKILNDKKTPGRKLSTRLLDRIGLSPEKRDHLLKSHDLSIDKIRAPKDEDFGLIEEDKFQVISHWYYFALLEIIDANLIVDPKEMAKSLDIPYGQVKIALERLQRIGLIKKIGKRWVDQTEGVSTVLNSQSLTSSARRNHQKELLEKSIEAIETVDISDRDHTSMTLAIDSRDLDKFRKITKEYRRKVLRLLSDSSHKNSVYNLSISMYPLTTLSAREK
jgi:uncharacterized protein (TIGR02147 family)